MIGPEEQKAMLQPFAAPIQVNLWGWDLLSQWGATINIPTISPQSRNIMAQMGYDFRNGLGKNQQDVLTNIIPQPKLDGSGIGYPNL